jgi:hypothetical protein
MRPPHYPSITRLSVRPDNPHAIVGPRPNKSRRPYPDAKVAEVRRLVEETTLTYLEIQAKSGISGGLACIWARNHGWKRPLFAARATDKTPHERASAHLRRRMLSVRLSALAERAVRELEESAIIDLDKLAEAQELLKIAKLAAVGRKRRKKGEEIRKAPQIFDAGPRDVMQGLRAAGVRVERAPEEAVMDFIKSRAPLPKTLTKRQREHKRMMERE